MEIFETPEGLSIREDNSSHEIIFYKGPARRNVRRLIEDLISKGALSFREEEEIYERGYQDGKEDTIRGQDE